MKPSPSAPAGATARPRSPEPPPDEGPALRVPGALSADPACAVDPLEPPGSPPSPSSPTIKHLRRAADAVTRLAQGPEDPADLTDASLADLLFWGLHTGRFDLAGVSGSVLAGIRGDLDVLIGYVDQDQIVYREVVCPALFRLRR